ncbi:uncharacterized protein LOC106140204 [Amyelois transitella]|uniref:uncharacterized protein LOC106140204 n=1 Tax=Amyelois transitella TaxID=680683 RepID=UPI00067D6C90|nr:uncharacterized protein LOC106140204 [Amyelois transitella]
MISSVNEQNNKFSALQTSIEEIKQQNRDIQKAMEFMSEKYEEIKSRLDKSEQERDEALIHVSELESRVDQLERAARNTSIEIRNIPSVKPETKEDLIHIVKNIASATNTTVTDHDIKDIFRYPSKTSAKMPIVVDFCSVLRKDTVLNAVKKFRSSNKSNLTSDKIKVSGPSQPVYISESLTARTKRTYALARKFASENNFKFCWTSHGQVYMRKEEGSRAIRLDGEGDINRLLNK